MVIDSQVVDSKGQDAPVPAKEEKIKAICQHLDDAQKELVSAQRAMTAANRLAGYIPMYKELNKRITELADWSKEVKRMSW